MSNVLTSPPTPSGKVKNRLTVFFKNNIISKRDKFQDPLHPLLCGCHKYMVPKDYENVSLS